MNVARLLAFVLCWGAGATLPWDGAPRGVDAAQVQATHGSASRTPLELVERWRAEGAAKGSSHSNVVSIGDLDGDGVREVIAQRTDLGSGAAGQAWVRYGASGKLRQVLGSGSLSFGLSLASVGDCDGDGLEEVLVVDGDESFDQVGGVGAMLLSTASGNPLQRWSDENGMGRRVLGLSDIDGDGAGDCGIQFGGEAGFVLLSGRSGGAIAWPDGDRLRARLEARLLARVADCDADGVNDFTCATKDGELVLVSGAARRALWTRPAFDGDWVIQESIAPTGDLDGDGFADLAAIEWNSGLDPSPVWRVVALSGRDGRTVRTHELSAPQGDTIALATLGGRAGASGSMLAIAARADEHRELVVWSPREDVVLHRQRLDASAKLAGLGELDGALLFAAADAAGEIRAYELRRAAR